MCAHYKVLIIKCVLIVIGRPRAKPPSNGANKLFTQFKAPHTSSQCKILDVISKSLALAEILAFWGAVWGPVRILPEVVI